MKINSNIPAYRSLNALTISSKKSEISSMKMSTGYKINSAGDDPAGLAISNKLKNQIKGLHMSSRNSLDGVSMIQTAEGALNEVHDMLQRMRELAVQSANGTLTNDDRAKIKMETDQLKLEIDQMAEKTEFNKIKLLNGSGDLTFKSDKFVTTNPGDPLNNTLKADIIRVSDTFSGGEYQVKVETMGTKATWTIPTGTAAWTPTTGTGVALFPSFPSEELAGKIYLNNEEIIISETDTASDVFRKISEIADITNLNVTINDQYLSGSALTGSAATFQPLLSSVESIYYGEQYTISATSDNYKLLASIGLIDAAANYTEGTNAVVTLQGDFDDSTIYSTDGNRVTIKDTNAREMVMDLNANLAQGDVVTTTVIHNQVRVQTGANEALDMTTTIPAINTKTLLLDKIDFRTIASSSKAITTLDNAISYVSYARAKLGAYQNRLENTINSLDSTSINTSQSLSRILDTDMAEEMAEYTKNNVIGQAAIAMISQANQRPQQLLQLLQ